MKEKKILQFFQDGSGQFSATRLAFLAWIFGALVVWSANSFQAREIQDIPDSVTVLVGILMTGKVAQKANEASGSNQVDGPQTVDSRETISSSPARNSAALSAS